MKIMLYLFSIESLITLLIIITSLILIPYSCEIIIIGANKSIISRIVSTDFSLTLMKTVSLTLGYFGGLSLFSVAIYILYFSKFESFSESQRPILAISSALCFCITARIIAREYGYIYGKRYISALTNSLSIIIIIKTIIFLNSFDILTVISYMHNIPYLFLIIYSNLFTFIKEILILSRNNVGFIFVGIISTVTLGEKIIGNSKAKNRSMTSVLEKFEPSFSSIPTKEGAEKKVDEMINVEMQDKNLKSIKIISRTLATFDEIYTKVVSYEGYKELDFKVIAPDLLLNDSVKTDKNHIYKRHYWTSFRKGKYKDRLKKLKNAEDKKELIWSKIDFNDLKLLIVNDKELLLSVKDGGKGRSSLYSNDPYIVQHSVQICNGFFPEKNSKEDYEDNIKTVKIEQTSVQSLSEQ